MVEYVARQFQRELWRLVQGSRRRYDSSENYVRNAGKIGHRTAYPPDMKRRI